MNRSEISSGLFGSWGGGLQSINLDSIIKGIPVQYEIPSYHANRPSILPFISDKYLSLLSPVLIYWVVSAWFFFLDTMQFPFFEKYRLHEPEEIQKRNRVSASRVLVMVLIQQVFQTMLGILVMESDETSLAQVFADHQGRVQDLAQKVTGITISTLGMSKGTYLLRLLGPKFANWLYWWGIPSVQFVWGCFVMDAWEYTLHRAFHESRWLYNNFHSHHHRLYVPYAFGALYNHPVEGFLLDSAGAAISAAAAFMTIRQTIVFFTFSIMKTVCDHGGYAFPPWLDPLHLFFPNTAEYHDVHHQMQGLRYNYSQPFFIHFDVLFGTRMSAEKFAKMKKINQRFKKGYKEANGSEDKFVSDEKALSDSIRRRGKENGDDASPEDIVLAQGQNGDPTVTLNGESYRAKAGIAT